MDLCCGREGCFKELWRLRFNWIYFMALGALYAISYTSISSSFHQFMTNPAYQGLNHSMDTATGLGQSELFYSWVIAVFNVGAFFGAVGTGILSKYIPYWHLTLLMLISHTLGYVLYAISYKGWVIVLSKFLSGIFIGGEMTLALSYFAESSAAYKNVLLQMGVKCDEGTLKRKLFAWHNIGVGIGYILGPGCAVVIAQFKIDQFRSIAWFNVAFGVAFSILQVVMFRGESSCKKLRSRCADWKRSKCDFKVNPQEIAILTFLILCRGVLSFRFGVYETIYNPVLSDSFGFEVKYASYFFLALVMSQISGTILLLILQQIKLGSRAIAIIGLLLSLLGCALMADWQAIRFDKCTYFSPYHNPTLDMNEVVDSSSHGSARNTVEHGIFNSNFGERISCNIVDKQFGCERISQECLLVQYLPGIKFDVHNYRCGDIRDDELLSTYMCHLDGKPVLCVYVNDTNEAGLQSFGETAQYLKYEGAIKQCTQASSDGDHCHWIPDSLITKRYCSDCPPICRALSRSLNFAQFCVGSALLMLSIPVAWVPVAAMASERTAKDMQGAVMGIVVALTAIGRTLSPLWLDAAYEGMKKRTFLAMTIMIVAQLPFLIIFIFMYQKLSPPSIKSEKSIIESSSEESYTSEDEHSSS